MFREHVKNKKGGYSWLNEMQHKTERENNHDHNHMIPSKNYQPLSRENRYRQSGYTGVIPGEPGSATHKQAQPSASVNGRARQSTEATPASSRPHVSRAGKPKSTTNKRKVGPMEEDQQIGAKGRACITNSRCETQENNKQAVGLVKTAEITTTTTTTTTPEIASRKRKAVSEEDERTSSPADKSAQKKPKLLPGTSSDNDANSSTDSDEHQSSMRTFFPECYEAGFDIDEDEGDEEEARMAADLEAALMNDDDDDNEDGLIPVPEAGPESNEAVNMFVEAASNYNDNMLQDNYEAEIDPLNDLDIDWGEAAPPASSQPCQNSQQYVTPESDSEESEEE